MMPCLAEAGCLPLLLCGERRWQWPCTLVQGVLSSDHSWGCRSQGSGVVVVVCLVGVLSDWQNQQPSPRPLMPT